MICHNCQQDTGNKQECPYCGYNPIFDGENATAKAIPDPIPPKPVRVMLKKIPNGAATASLVFSLLSIIPLVNFITSPLSMLLGIIGFFKAKTRRCGRVKSIISILLSIIFLAITVVLLFIGWQYIAESGLVDAFMDALQGSSSTVY
jgi:hypothetical protein